MLWVFCEHRVSSLVAGYDFKQKYLRASLSGSRTNRDISKDVVLLAGEVVLHECLLPAQRNTRLSLKK